MPLGGVIVVVRSSALPKLSGAYVYGDYSTGRVWAMKHDGTKVEWHKELATTRMQISAFEAYITVRDEAESAQLDLNLATTE